MNVPDHLKKYIVDQEYELYTYIDHAVWRYIMKISIDFFEDHAHSSYRNGLEKTGITINRIPRIDDMNSLLQKFGWRAVCVRGFIPPKAFMEFQSLSILPIAADMRSFNHLTYTPAPDIVHESAGHAPIIVDPDYSEYLSVYGDVATKSILSLKDIEIYNLIRKLSDVKENESKSSSEIKEIEEKINSLMNSIEDSSEASELARMNWWTVEYGLIGDIDSPKIYGAGLLSSVAESQNCLSDSVEKIPFSLKCIDYPYDITEQQPQLFICKDFKELTRALNEYRETMAYKVGGQVGLDKAISAQTINTCENDIGIQISGKFSDMICHNEEPIYIQLSGPVQISYKGTEIAGHGGDYHNEGYGTIVGNLSGSDKPLHSLDSDQLSSLGIEVDSHVDLRFTGDVKLAGIVERVVNIDGYNVIISFSDCTVQHGEKVLFMPEWGMYDLVCSGSIVSVYSGASDIQKFSKYLDYYDSPICKDDISSNISSRADIDSCFKEIREIRESRSYDDVRLENIYHKSVESGYNNWLINMEILELICDSKSPFANKLRSNLASIAVENSDLGRSIGRGIPIYSDSI